MLATALRELFILLFSHSVSLFTADFACVRQDGSLVQVQEVIQLQSTSFAATIGFRRFA